MTTDTAADAAVMADAARQRYEEVLRAVWTEARSIARERGWCAEWVAQLRRASREFPADRAAPVTDIVVPGYAKLTADLRGRLGALVEANDQISADDVNRVLRAAGLEEFATDGENYQYDVSFSLTGRLKVTSEERLTRMALENRVSRAVNVESSEWEVVVQGCDWHSIEIDEEEAPGIDAADTVGLLPGE